MATIAHALKVLHFDDDGYADTIYKEYWLVTMLRGFIAILAGTVILITPQIATTVLLMPFTIIVSIVGLGAYGLIDSAWSSHPVSWFPGTVPADSLFALMECWVQLSGPFYLL